jgi:hypothetical protein
MVYMTDKTMGKKMVMKMGQPKEGELEFQTVCSKDMTTAY